MKNGKKICDQLKKVRKEIAEANGIDYQPHECTHTGDCLGTCPRCESEVRELTLQLQKRHKAGKLLRVAGVAVGALSTVMLAPSCGRSNVTEGETLLSDTTHYADTTTHKEDSILIQGEVENSHTTVLDIDTNVLFIEGMVEPALQNTPDNDFAEQPSISNLLDTTNNSQDISE